MANLVSASLPSLIQGVSQQPINVRLPTQCEDMVNAWPNPLRGVDRRQPTEWVGELIGTVDDDAFIHTYRDGVTGQHFGVVVEDNSIRVFDLDTGDEKTVNTPDGTDYINVSASTAPKNAFRAITIADYTFLVNVNQTIAKDSEKSDGLNTRAYVECVQGAYGTRYAVGVQRPVGTGVGSAAIRTPNGADAADATEISTEQIINDLAAALQADLPAGWNINTPQDTMEITTNGGVITDFAITTSDGLGNAALRATKDKVQRFADLPYKCRRNIRIEVEGDNTTAFDNYYVICEPKGGTNFGDAVWTETIGFDLEIRLDATTMPHVLIEESDGTFTFREADWIDRLVGDDTSNPFPTFVGRQINDVFFYKNRLGFLSDENVIMSRAGDFFNFFRESALVLSESDPIDVAVSNAEVAILRHAVPFGGRMILFSENAQFEFEFGEVLSPQTAAVNKRTAFRSDAGKPIATGKTILFGATSGTVSQVREYYIQTEDVHDAVEITGHVPELIDGPIKRLAVDLVNDAMFVVTDNLPTRLYLYRYFWGQESGAQNTKLLSSWSYWDFPHRILDVAVLGDYLYLFMLNANDDLELEKIFLSPAQTHDENSDWQIYLDRWLHLEDAGAIAGFSTSYNSGTDTTTITVPYDVTADGRTPALVRVYKEGFEETQPAGEDTPLTQTGANTFTAQGNLTVGNSDQWRFGMRYETKFEFSKPVVRETTAAGDRVAVTEGRLQVLRWTINYGNTAFTRMEITPFNRDTRAYEYRSPLYSDGGASGKLRTGSLKGFVRAKNTEFSVRLKNDTWYPSSWTNAEYEATFYLRSDRF